jgi:hypothetical protein
MEQRARLKVQAVEHLIENDAGSNAETDTKRGFEESTHPCLPASSINVVNAEFAHKA